MSSYPITSNELEQWRFLLTHPFDTNTWITQLLQLSATKRNDDAHAWFASCYQWWAARTSRTASPHCEGLVSKRPSPFWCPFPMAHAEPNLHKMGFLAAFSGQSRNWDASTQPTSQETQVLQDIQDSLEATKGSIRFVLPYDENGHPVLFDGNSYALASLIALLSATLKLPIDGKTAASGAWSVEHHRFVPIEAATLQTKRDVLLRWGYDRLLLIRGQPGLGANDVPIRPDPQDAVFDILDALWPSEGRKAFLRHCDRQRSSGAVTPFFVGRIDVFKTFMRWLRNRGGTPIFWLHGESGIGKTQFVNKIIDHLRSRSDWSCVACHNAGDPEEIERFQARAALAIARSRRLQISTEANLDAGQKLDLVMEEARNLSPTGSANMLWTIDALDKADSEWFRRIEMAVALQIPVLISSTAPVPGIWPGASAHTLQGLSPIEVRAFLERAIGPTALAAFAHQTRYNGEDCSVEQFSDLLCKRTGGRPIYLDLIRTAMRHPGEWMPAADMGFSEYAGRKIADRLSDIGNPELMRPLLAVLAFTSSYGGISEDALIAILRLVFPRTPKLHESIGDMLGLLRFVVSAWGRPLRVYRVDHALVAAAIRQLVGEDWMREAKKLMADWCCDVGRHGHHHALRHGPAYLSASDDPVVEERLYELARDSGVHGRLMESFRHDAARLAGFAQAAMNKAVGRTDRAPEGAEFALRVAQARAIATDGVDWPTMTSSTTPRRMPFLIEQLLPDQRPRKLAALVTALAYLTTPNAFRLHGDVEVLLGRFFSSQANRSHLNDHYRDASISLMAAVLSRWGTDEERLHKWAYIFRNSLDMDRWPVLAHSILQQSALLREPNTRARLLDLAVEIVSPRSTNQKPASEASANDVGGERTLMAPSRIEATQVNMDGFEFPLHDLVSSLLSVGQVDRALVLLRAWSDIDWTKWSWIAVDILEELARREDGQRAWAIHEEMKTVMAINRSLLIDGQSARSAGHTCSITSQELVGLTACYVADRAKWQPERLASKLREIEFAVKNLNPNHQGQTLARIAYLAAVGGCGDIASRQLKTAYSLARYAKKDPLGQCGWVIRYTSRASEHITIPTEDRERQLKNAEQLCVSRAAELARDDATHRSHDDVKPLLRSQANLSKAWANIGNYTLAYQFLFKKLPIDTASPLRGEALAEIALRAFEANEEWRWITGRNPLHRLTVISRIVGRLCQTGDYARAMQMVSDELSRVAERDGSKVWGRPLLQQASDIRTHTSGDIPLPVSASRDVNKRMWQLVNFATLAACCPGDKGDAAAKHAMGRAWDELGACLGGMDLANLGYEMCRFRLQDLGGKCFAKALIDLGNMESPAVQRNRFKLEGELLEKLALCGNSELVGKVEDSLWSHAGRPSFHDNEGRLCEVAFQYSRAAVRGNIGTDRINAFLDRLREKLGLRKDLLGPAEFRAATAVAMAAEKRFTEAEGIAGTINKVRERSDAFGEIAHAYTVNGMSGDATRLASTVLLGRQIKNVIRFVLPLQLDGKREFLLAMLPAASRFLESAVWAAAGIIATSNTITVEHLQRICSALDAIDASTVVVRQIAGE